MTKEAVNREAKGVLLAATALIARTPDGRYAVPSSAPARTYAVDLEAGTCTCPDHANRKVRCKHLFAAEYVAKRESAPPSTPLGKEYLARLIFLWTRDAGWAANDNTMRYVTDRLQALPSKEFYAELDAVKDADRLAMTRALAGAL